MTRREILNAYKAGKLSAIEVQESLRKHKQQSFRSPLSEGQKGLWMLQKMSPDMSAFNLSLCFRIGQKLDIEKFKKACLFVLEQYPILSSAIGEENGVPYQTVKLSQPLALQLEDISALESHKILPYLRRKAKEPFSLEEGSLMRIHLLTRSEQEHIVLITIHHIIFDGSSIQPLMTTLMGTYQDLIQGKNPVPNPSSTSYSDFVHWEQRMLASKEGEKHLSFWKQQLSGTLPTLEFPTDRPRFSAQSFKGETHRILLPSELTKRIKSFAQSQQVNLSVVFLGLFKVLLHRYTGQEDVIVGMPTMGRPQERFDSLVGYFINMIPVRSQVVGTQSFSKFIKELQLIMVDGLDHAAYPFPAIVRELNMPRTAYSPVFQVSFSYQNFLHKNTQDLQDRYSIEFVEGVNQEGENELVLEVFEQEDRFILYMKYNPDLFDFTTITRIMEHYVNLAEGVINNPTLTLEEYSLMSKDEQDTILIHWNATQAHYPDKCFHELFEEQVQKTPNAIAVVYEERSLTYGELDEKSTWLALYLQKQGVKPDGLVGICVERSLEMIVGLLGILKAGGAYVPLDPDYPADRLEYMIQDSKVLLVLTQSGLMDKISPLLSENTRAIVLDSDWEQIERTAKIEKTLKREVQTDHLAYVIYTSGSTGKPKGVMIPHKALTNFLITMGKKPGLNSQDKLLAVTTYSFDIHGLELYLPLINGAQCFICNAEKTKDVEKLKQEIQKLRPTIMQATPVTWTMLLHAGWKNKEKTKVLCGGEALPERLKQFFIDTNSDAWNMFGPTETTIWSTVQQVKEKEPITIGKPIANTQVYILDKNLKPTPIGITGELCIAGDGLARGYLNKTELTAEKFIDNPFNPGTKLYKVGDLARWLLDGSVEFLGRTDHQVKIRGFRIELGEIESQLNTHPDIQNSVVIVKEQEGNKQLIAYYVLRDQNHNNGEVKDLLGQKGLREFLRVNLPEYMIPAVFIQLDEIPLTPNGKIDRKELMNRKVVLTRSKKANLPQSNIEEKLLDIWKDVLNVSEISTEDGFFEVGGNSFLAVTVAQRIKSHFHCDINVTALFKYSNIKELSTYIAEIKGVDTDKHFEPEKKMESDKINIKEIKIKKDCGKTSYPDYYQESIAIIGISCHFPGATNHIEFWNNLREGKESVRLFSKEELQEFSLPKEIINNPNYIPKQSTIEGKDLFDPGFFKISPRDAEFMDPQLRLLLLHSWKAIEDAGYIPKHIPETGVFMSASNCFYQALLPHVELQTTKVMTNSEEYVSWMFAQGGTIPTIISYKLGLRGPSYFVHSNCSSSLTGLYSAYQSLRLGDAKYALVGSATILPFSNLGYVHQPGLNFSSDGHIKAFDASADGMVTGEGVAVIVLKKALDAIEDGDHIYALIRGISINNDGAEKVGYYAPSIKGQAEVIQKVLDHTGVNPESISYVEAHGTGTKLGDPIELTALSDTYRQYTTKKQFCGIGSVKTNVGHLDTAAGLAGCIKTALSLYHNEIPPSINFDTPNPNFDWNNSPFYVVDKLEKWANSSVPHRAALSAFGIGGTNTHVILEQHTIAQTPRSFSAVSCGNNISYVIPLSANNDDRTNAYAQELLDYLKTPQGRHENMANLAYTLQVGREAMESRLIFIVNNTNDLIQRLEEFVTGKENIEGCFRGEINKSDSIQLFENDKEFEELIRQWTIRGKIRKLAELWVKGLHINWELLYPDIKPRRISLPTYPFARERYWLPEIMTKSPGSKAKASARATSIHPLLHENTSDLSDREDSAGLNTMSGFKIKTEEHLESFTNIDTETLISASVEHLKALIAEITKIPIHKLDPDEFFEELGLDSIIISNLNKRIEQWLGKSDVTLFFKYKSIRVLGAFFAETYPDAISELVNKTKISTTIHHNQPLAHTMETPALVSIRSPKPSQRQMVLSASDVNTCTDIAIIGVAGRYPKAAKLDQFWNNLYEGRDCIEEIPPNRWTLDGFFEPDRTEAFKKRLSYSKWGGFLDNIDCFDPLFFNISPIDAIAMDPQERLFLEVTWECLENAGYSPGSLKQDGYGNRIGVFVGATYNNYQLFITEAALQSNQSMYAVNSQMFSIANRVSYVMNFTGPSLTVDTACSSSLYAIHLACESIRSGQSRMAIAGGVNLSLHPSKYITLCQRQFNASDGRCRSFCEGGTGYVPSEAVGAVFLKPLKNAIKDNDHIYGIIKGSATSHAGKTNGYTVPSPVSQSLAIEKALELSQIHPRSISCIEAHGTGTALGDPIEITGLTDVFRKYTKETGFCSISSVKSSIGHAEAAAGMAQLTKVLLQFKHQTLVKNVKHGEGLNPNIDFAQTPFVVQENTEYWKRPIINGREVPRRAGISSFGAGGSNAHIVIEEYTPNGQERSPIAITPRNPAIIVLSAKNEERLQEQSKQLLAALQGQQFSDLSLADMAYTLQVGREAMEERLAVIVGSIKELEEKLKGFLEGQDDIPDLYRGKSKRNKETLSVFTADEELQDAIKKWIQRKKYAKLLDLWVKGLNIDWNTLYDETKPGRISLPTYPFARESYWVSGIETKAANRPAAASLMAASIHPLLHQNISDFSGQPESEAGSGGSSETFGMLMLHPCWKEQAIDWEAPAADYAQHLVMLCELGEGFRKSIETHMNKVRCLTLESKQKGIEERFQIYAAQAFEEIQSIFKERPKGKVLIQIVVPVQGEQQLFSGLSGLLKTARLENPKFTGQLIEVEPGEDSEGIIEKLRENSRCPIDNQIRYQAGKRLLPDLSEVEVTREEAHLPWKDRGIYLITGGAGGLGLIFANEVAHKAKDATLILTGRSRLSEDKEAKLKDLEILGARIVYKQVDVTHRNAVTELVQGIQDDFGNLNGIIHGAGVIQDNFIIRKTKDEFIKVLAPKVIGVVNLDHASKDLTLDFFVLFSSLTGSIGNTGQADYAAASAFMDAFARYRNDLVALKQRQGQTLSINWPLWKEGGMRVDEETETRIRQNIGMIAMQTQTGIIALYQGLASGQSQVMVMEGDLQRMQERLETSSKVHAHPTKASVPQADPGLFREKTLHQLKALFGEITQMGVAQIDAEELLENYGIDSIKITRLNQKLSGVFGELSKTLFYEYQTLGALAEYFIADHPQECMKWTGLGNQAKSIPETPSAVLPFERRKISVLTSMKTEEKQARGFTGMDSSNKTREAIAIIGMSGRYPHAKTLKDYWENLKAGRDCITEISEERWPMEEFYHPDPQEALEQGKSYCKWGGFLEGFTDFDPLFFNISPREAFNMDPQERLFLEECWKALEDAGYTRKQLVAQYSGRIGVFAGITKTGFSLYGPDLWKQGERVFPHTSFSSVANRVSYLLNLQGPSMPIDTMCSSSLTAIHEACQHLHHGECEMAFAGGVNLYLHLSSYIALCAQQMLSVDGRCKSFGRGGSGFVPGEGVGVVLLKRLPQALADGDHIYAVIRGTSINHGGKTNGYTVPNPTAQRDLIRAALDKAGVNARAISYIEAHGTGTELGDPIEITGLTQAFRKDTQETGFCAIGSAKSNIGHLEAAAGIAGVAKIVLQMKHRHIVPSLHAEELNPNIDFAKTPFVVQQELEEWKRPVVRINGETREYPRMAGISSFGAGGSNAHVVIEEYIPKEQEQPPIVITPQNPAIIVLSAKNEERLQERARQLLVAIQEHQFYELSLADMAYTLQVGREAMEERLAVMVGSIKELEEKLKGFVEGQDGIPDLYRGQVIPNKETLTVFAADEDMLKTINAWITKRKYAKLLDLWVKGLTFDWNMLYGDTKPHRISLPTYPFTRERHWISRIETNSSIAGLSVPKTSDGVIAHRTLENIPESIMDIDDTVKALVEIITDISGHKTEDIKQEQKFSELGFDSINIMKMARKVINSFELLDSSADNSELLQFLTTKEASIKGLVNYIKDKRVHLGVGYNGENSCYSDDQNVDEINVKQKKHQQNVICRDVKIIAKNPYTISGKMIVDETHPFFFDHPLDHVSGMQLTEAMSEMAKTGLLFQSKLDPQTSLFIPEINLSFDRYCKKDMDSYVRAVAVQRDENDNGIFFNTEVNQEGKIVANGNYKIIKGSFSRETRSQDQLNKTVELNPINQTIVNKSNEINVLISEVVTGNNSLDFGCYLFPQPNNNFFSDFPGEFIDTVILLEACRQSARAFRRYYLERQNKIQIYSKAIIPILKSMSIKINRLVHKEETVFLKKDYLEIIDIGNSSTLELRGLIMIDGYEIGWYKIKSLVLEEDLLSKMRSEQAN